MSPSKPPASAAAAYLGLGSNLGDRRAHLSEALRRLHGHPGIRVVAASSLYATAPVGLEGPEFLNAAAKIETELEPDALLDACLAVEQELGRVRGPGPQSRTIDIDLLVYGGVERSGERLALPHPRMTRRAFALLPLAEIAPDLIVAGRSVADWAAAADLTGVRVSDNPASWASV